MTYSVACYWLMTYAVGYCRLMTYAVACYWLITYAVAYCRLMTYAVAYCRLMTYAVACYWLMTYAVAYCRLMTYAVANCRLMTYAVAYCRLMTYAVAYCRLITWRCMLRSDDACCEADKLPLHPQSTLLTVACCYLLLSLDACCYLRWPAVDRRCMLRLDMARRCLLLPVKRRRQLLITLCALFGALVFRSFAMCCTERCTPVVCCRTCVWLAWFVVALSGWVKTFTWGIADREFWNDWTLSLWLHTPSLSVSAFSVHARENWRASYAWQVGFLL